MSSISTPRQSVDHGTTVKCPINYKLEWFNQHGDLLKTFASDSPFGGLELSEEASSTSPDSEESDAILEVIRKVEGPDPSIGRESEEFSKIAVDNIIISKFTSTRVIIRSKLLINTIRNMALYYPPQALSETSLEILEPYHILMHHLDGLTRLFEELSGHSKAVTIEDGYLEDSLSHHLRVLLDFLQPVIRQQLKPIQERLERTEPVVTFDSIWYLFQPGKDVYAKDKTNGMIHAGVFSHIEEGSHYDEGRHLKVQYFVLESDGSILTRNGLVEVVIDHFIGEKEVLLLDVYPSKYCGDRDGGARRRDFEANGQKYLQLLRAGPQFMNLSGYAYSTRRIKVIWSPSGSTLAS